MEDNHPTVWQGREMVEHECWYWEGEMKEEAEQAETSRQAGEEGGSDKALDYPLGSMKPRESFRGPTLL